MARIITLILLLPISVFGDSKDKPFNEARAIVTEYFEEVKPPGLSLSIGYQDRIVWSIGLGLADLEQKVSVNPSKSKFRIGSVAKPFTGFVLNELYKDSKIDLYKDIRKYVPSFPKKENSFTVLQVATHLAGIRHYRDNEPYSDVHYPDLNSSLSIFKNDALIHKPGTAYRYSSYGYVLLGAALEAASGQDFDELMNEELFRPLGMKNTVADSLANIIPNRVRYYRNENSVFFNEKEVDNYYKLPAGGYLSTTNDMVLFGLSLLTEKYFNKESKDLFWRSYKTDSGQDNQYGIGFRVVEDKDYGDWIGHGGGSIGGTSQFWIIPKYDLVIASASNQTELDYQTLILDIRNHFIELIESGKLK
ncbi:serine hydrolase domain-containing protein [Pleionea sediminis]|uniref:serine hydrolase domain-containing protein n=1 Tax=Pleionea sediminis TaxID=2569479 RepID=UPI00118678C9|nr:serine hydrolase domain-containing protein [Pleionea sediminis]